MLAARPGDPETAAWATYQLASCRRKQAPDAAVKLYDKVRQESPDCPWRDAAEAGFRTLEWIQVQKIPSATELAELAAPPAPTPPALKAPTSKPAQE